MSKIRNSGPFFLMKGESSNNTLWKAIKYNVFGHITQFVVGNSIVTNKGYDVNTGRITRINTTLGDNIFQDLMYSYDDFGNFALRRKMNSPVISETFTYDNINTTFDRGFCMHEHHYDFGLINMNGRMYDPYTSMFLSPDNYIQAPDNSQSFNRYAYCLNNPLKYTDPSGESFIGAAVAIGAIIGAYSGGVLANGTYNPIEWNWSSGNTYAYMIGGAVVGGVSSGIGAYIAGSNVVFSNTFGIMAASAINSAGTWLYTNGNSDFTMSFGIASYNLTQNKWGYIGKKGNSILQNIGFAMGSIANISDMYEFVSWDLLSYEQRFNKLSKWANKHHGEKNMIYDNTIDDFGNYDPKSRTIYIHDNALNQNFALAKSTYLHELNHRNEMSLDMIHNIIMYGAEDLRKQYYNEADLRAYRFELDNMSKVGTTYTQYKEILKQYNNYGGTNSYTYTLWDLLKNIVLP